MIKIIAIFGPEGTNKKELLDNAIAFSNNQLFKIIRETTEKNINKDFHYLDAFSFTNKLLNNEIIEAVCNDNIIYGTSISALDANNINIGIYDIESIECLNSNPDIEVIPIFIINKEKDRIINLIDEYKDGEKACNQFLKDNIIYNKDFDFNYFTLYIKNNKKLNDLYIYLKEYLNIIN